jgi:hypothetical protein
MRLADFQRIFSLPIFIFRVQHNRISFSFSFSPFVSEYGLFSCVLLLSDITEGKVTVSMENLD